jgi:hypothetical protein
LEQCPNNGVLKFIHQKNEQTFLITPIQPRKIPLLWASAHTLHTWRNSDICPSMKKIDIYIKYGSNKWFDYYASTNMAKTCKEAKARFLSIHSGLHSSQVKANFAR